MNTFITDNSIPKFALFISAGVQVVPQRSTVEPKVCGANAACDHAAPVERFAPAATLAFSSLTVASCTTCPGGAPVLRFDTATIPTMFAPAGIVKPKPCALIRPDVAPFAKVQLAVTPVFRRMLLELVQVGPVAAVPPNGPWFPLVDPDRDTLACTETSKPVIVAYAGMLKVVPLAKMLTELLCTTEVLLNATEANSDPDSMLPGEVQAGTEEVPAVAFAAALGVWVNSLSTPVDMEAYDTLPKIPVGLDHALSPTSTSVATAGTFGPRNRPLNDTAVACWLE